MNRFTPTIAFLAIAFATVLQVAAQSSASTPCKVGTQAPAFGFWTWAPKTAVKVYILSADFEASELPHLLVPLKNWNAVSEATGSGVMFEYVGPTSAPLYCDACLTIMRGPVFDKATRHATELRTYSAHRDQIMTWAQIVIDPVLTNPKALTNAIAHELGHNFGLLDCYSCKKGSTVMNQFKTMNVPNDMEGPTACDIAQVKAVYKELLVRVRPSPQFKVVVVDEGEEPVDDYTPVTLPKRP